MKNLDLEKLLKTLKGGVIMDVTTPEQAKIAEEAGAVSVMALERVPADIRWKHRFWKRSTSTSSMKARFYRLLITNSI